MFVRRNIKGISCNFTSIYLKINIFNSISINHSYKFHLSQISKQPFSNNNHNKSNLKNYKTNKDHIISGYFNDGSARFVFSDISNILTNSRQRFDLYEYDKLKQLSLAYNTTILMNTFLSGEERVRLSSQFSSRIFNDVSDKDTRSKKVLATSLYSESICTGEVRGFIQETVFNEDEFDFEINNFLKISKILYNQKNEVSGMIKLNENRLTEDDIYRYFEESEQIKTFVKFPFDYNEKEDKMISQGFLLQKMPDCDIEIMERNFYKIINSKSFNEINVNGLAISVLQNLFKEINLDVNINGRIPIDFFCRCSIETFKTALKTFRKSDVMDMKAKNHNKLKCKNCNTSYTLTETDFNDILKDVIM